MKATAAVPTTAAATPQPIATARAEIDSAVWGLGTAWI